MATCGCVAVSLLTISSTFHVDDAILSPSKRVKPAATDVPVLSEAVRALIAECTAAETQANTNLQRFIENSASKRQLIVSSFQKLQDELESQRRAALCAYDSETQAIIKSLEQECEAYHVRATQAASLSLQARSTEMPDLKQSFQLSSTNSVDVVILVDALQSTLKELWSVAHCTATTDLVMAKAAAQKSSLQRLNEAIAEQTAKAVEVESELASLKWQDDFKKAANPEANVKNRLTGGCIVTMRSRFPKGTSAIAIDATGSRLAVAHAASCRVELYSLPEFQLQTTLGYSESEGPGPFDAANPQKMCFAPNGNLLVAEHNFNRIQEVVPRGNDDHIRYIGEGVFTRGVHGLACNDTVIVATQPDSLFEQVLILDYKSGCEIRRFGVYGYHPGQLKGSQAVCITPDGRHVVIAETDNHRVSVFTMEGEFVKCFGNKDMLNGPVDVCVADSGEIAVVSKGRKAVVVFPGMLTDESCTPRCFGGEGVKDGQFTWPSASAMFRGKLFVADQRSERVQVFV